MSYQHDTFGRGHVHKLQQQLRDKLTVHNVSEYTHFDTAYDIVTRNDKIVILLSLQVKSTEWYHLYILHPGETRMELTMGQHYCWKGMRNTIQKVCKACAICKTTKVRNSKYGLLPPKNPETIPWHTLCIDLIGPYKFGDEKNLIQLHCLTMIDPATGWFEIAEIPTKKADDVVNILEFSWLTRYPWPTDIIMDRRKEFAAEVQHTIKNEYGITRKLTTTRNPQANDVVE